MFDWIGAAGARYGPDMYHPWRALRALPHVTLAWVRMPSRLGATNGIDYIWMHPAQLQVERRCTLTHELVHLERRHTTGCHPRVERKVRAETARRLITLDRLVDEMRWAVSLDEAADDLWVTRAVLDDRLATLAPHEAQVLAEVMLRA